MEKVIMILIYHKDESPQVRDVALKDLKDFHPPYSEKSVRDADKVFVVEGERFRIFKDRDAELLNPDSTFPLSSIHLLLKDAENSYKNLKI
jgi:hypothetical protein